MYCTVHYNTIPPWRTSINLSQSTEPNPIFCLILNFTHPTNPPPFSPTLAQSALSIKIHSSQTHMLVNFTLVILSRPFPWPNYSPAQYLAKLRKNGMERRNRKEGAYQMREAEIITWTARAFTLWRTPLDATMYVCYWKICQNEPTVGWVDNGCFWAMICRMFV